MRNQKIAVSRFGSMNEWGFYSADNQRLLLDSLPAEPFPPTAEINLLEFLIQYQSGSLLSSPFRSSIDSADHIQFRSKFQTRFGDLQDLLNAAGLIALVFEG